MGEIKLDTTDYVLDHFYHPLSTVSMKKALILRMKRSGLPLVQAFMRHGPAEQGVDHGLTRVMGIEYYCMKPVWSLARIYCQAIADSGLINT